MALVVMLMPFFNQLADKSLDVNDLIQPKIVGGFILLALITGLARRKLSGILPLCFQSAGCDQGAVREFRFSDYVAPGAGGFPVCDFDRSCSGYHCHSGADAGL